MMHGQTNIKYSGSLQACTADHEQNKLPYCSWRARKKKPLNKDKYLIILMLGSGQIASSNAAPNAGLAGQPIYKELLYV